MTVGNPAPLDVENDDALLVCSAANAARPSCVKEIPDKRFSETLICSTNLTVLPSIARTATVPPTLQVVRVG
jgi:hypothetical protein